MVKYLVLLLLYLSVCSFGSILDRLQREIQTSKLKSNFKVGTLTQMSENTTYSYIKYHFWLQKMESTDLS